MASRPPRATELLRARVEVVLVGTLKGGNVGAVARAMKNMGLERLTLVAPEADLDDEQARWFASGAEDVLAGAKRRRTLPAALGRTRLVVGTTSGRGRRAEHAGAAQRRSAGAARLESPRALARRLLPMLAENDVALVFGPEAKGLNNDQLDLCNVLCRIPSDARSPVLNLAQSVMVLLYELRVAALEAQAAQAPKTTAGAERGGRRLASRATLAGLRGHLEEALSAIGFLAEGQRERSLADLFGVLARAELDDREVRMWRGVCRQILWTAGQARATIGST